MVKTDSIKSGRRLGRRLLHALILLGVGGLFSLALVLVQPFYTFNLWFADQFLDSYAPSTNIIIASIDDASLEAHGKWSQWPRSLHTEAINNLTKAGASVIRCYDVSLLPIAPRTNDSFGEANKKLPINVVLVIAGTDRLASKMNFDFFPGFFCFRRIP